MKNQMNDFLVAETYSYALFSGIFFTRWVKTTALIMAFLFTPLSQGTWRRWSSCHGKQKPDDYINVTIELDDMDITSAETKATYDEIKKYVAEHNAGMKVSNLYISQVKRKCGIEVGKNYNLPKNVDSRQPQCPEDKESAIVEALKHFKMI